MLDGSSRRGVRGALDEHHRRTALDLERGRLLGVRERRLEPLVCAHGHGVVARADQVVERAFERAVEQARKGVDRIRTALERDRLSVRKTYALDRIDARAELGLVLCCFALARREHSRPCGKAESPELIRERGGAGELELRLGDERASVAALA